MTAHELGVKHVELQFFTSEMLKQLLDILGKTLNATGIRWLA